MATNSSQASLTPATAQSNFEQAVALTLHTWPALTLSVQNNWGGESSDDKRDWFAGAVVDLFAPFERLVNGVAAPRQQPDSDYEEPDADYIEEFLLNVMMDEFDVNVDDDSGYDVAKQIVVLRSDFARGRFDALTELQTKWQSRKGKKVQAQAAAGQEDDDDSDSSDDDDDEPAAPYTGSWADDVPDEDVEMGEAPQLVAAPRAKPQPEVDDDGFTVVTRKR